MCTFFDKYRLQLQVEHFKEMLSLLLTPRWFFFVPKSLMGLRENCSNVGGDTVGTLMATGPVGSKQKHF
jgi:hypothetical protein